MLVQKNSYKYAYALMYVLYTCICAYFHVYGSGLYCEILRTFTGMNLARGSCVGIAGSSFGARSKRVVVYYLSKVLDGRYEVVVLRGISREP